MTLHPDSVRTQALREVGRLMHELKQRSGLSYEVLARRSLVSTSTLHRYCRGGDRCAVVRERGPVRAGLSAVIRSAQASAWHPWMPRLSGPTALLGLPGARWDGRGE